MWIYCPDHSLCAAVALLLISSAICPPTCQPARQPASPPARNSSEIAGNKKNLLSINCRSVLLQIHIITMIFDPFPAGCKRIGSNVHSVKTWQPLRIFDHYGGFWLPISSFFQSNKTAIPYFFGQNSDNGPHFGSL